MISPVIIAALIGLIGGALIGLFVGALGAAAAKRPECPECHDGKVVLFAGSLERDDGYCELKMCSTCDDGRRIGRSDMPIVTAPAPSRPGGHLREAGS